jgi:hypothetical protein
VRTYILAAWPAFDITVLRSGPSNAAGEGAAADDAQQAYEWTVIFADPEVPSALLESATCTNLACGAGCTATLSAAPVAIDYDITDLEAGVPVWVRASARNTLGFGAASAAVPAVPTAPATEVREAALETLAADIDAARAAGDETQEALLSLAAGYSLYATWRAPFADGESEVVAYRIERYSGTTVTAPDPAVQTVRVSATAGSPIFGSFRLTLDTSGAACLGGVAATAADCVEDCTAPATSPCAVLGVYTTEPLSTGASAADVKRALERLPNVQGSVDVVASDIPALASDGGREWRITFRHMPFGVPPVLPSLDEVRGEDMVIGVCAGGVTGAASARNGLGDTVTVADVTCDGATDSQDGSLPDEFAWTTAVVGEDVEADARGVFRALLQDLQPGVEYVARVAAINAFGAAEFIVTMPLAPPKLPPQAPIAPLHRDSAGVPFVSVAGPDSLLVEWGRPLHDGGDAVTPVGWWPGALGCADARVGTGQLRRARERRRAAPGHGDGGPTCARATRCGWRPRRARRPRTWPAWRSPSAPTPTAAS